MNYRLVVHLLGVLLVINGGFMLSCIPFSLYYGEGGLPGVAFGGGATALAGALLWLLTRNVDKSIRKKEGYMIVTLGWVVMSLTGCLPYLITDTIQDFSSAFFETISGYTTTGASVLTDIEAAPKGILFWRSLTHWIGGMGIIVLALAILPLLGIGGMQLFIAESPGPSADKIQPRIQETAKRLWIIYVLLTFVETIFLMFGGMSFYDAINHSMSTLSTGGFSTQNASIAGQSAYIQYVIIVFMFLAGINFSLVYFGLKGKLRKVWKNEEFRVYFLGILGTTLVAAAVIYAQTDLSAETSFRDSLFQVTAVITTTGFVSADFTAWVPFLTMLFFVLMFVGGSAGSTAGGVKIVRHLIILKNSIVEFRRLIHPSAIVPVRLNGRAVTQEIVFNILAFLILYILIFFAGAMAMSAMGVDFVSSVGSSASCLGNVGPGLGIVGPVENYAAVPAGGKWLLSFEMLVGRLELFTVLILLTPWFWKRT